MSAKKDTAPLDIEITNEPKVPDTLPVMPLKNFVLFPRMVTPLVVTTEQSKKLVAKLSERTPHFIAVLQRKEEIDEAHLAKDDIHRTGCVARMIKTLNFPDGSTHILVEGLSRCTLKNLNTKAGFPTAKYRMVKDAKDASLETEALARNASEKFQQIVTMSPNLPDELAVAIFNMDTPEQLSDLLATNLPVPIEVCQSLLADNQPGRRLKTLMGFINHEFQIQIRIAGFAEFQVVDDTRHRG